MTGIESIERTNNNRQLSKDKFSAPVEFIKAITPFSELSELLTRMSGLIVNLLNAKDCIIRLKENGAPKIKAHSGLNDATYKIMSHKLGEKLTSQAMTQGVSLLVKDTSTLTKELKILQLINKSILCVPIKKEDEVLGTIELYNKINTKSLDETESVIPFTEEDQETLEGISLLASLAIDKASAYNELKKSNLKLSRLFFTSSFIQGTLQLKTLLRLVLSVVTMTDGVGFNRAILFLYDKEKNSLKGNMGAGPASYEEAWTYWQNSSHDKKDLPEILKEIEKGPLRQDTLLDKKSTQLEISMNEKCILTQAVRERKSFNITNALINEQPNPIPIDTLSTNAYAVVPLIARDKVIGVLWVDNLFNRDPITDDDMDFLSGFANQCATAIEKAGLFEKACHAENELENLFESISDIIYTTDIDFRILKANKAACDVVNKSSDEIEGKKCYEVFNKSATRCRECLHYKTLKAKKSHISEIKGFCYNEPDKTYVISTSPMFDPIGNVSGTVQIVRNITELADLREQLSQTEKVAALGEMAAGVAHAIRNPLVSIGGFARRLEKKIDSSHKDYARIIVDEVSRLEKLLKDTLGYVGNKQRVKKESVKINDILVSSIQLLRESFKNDVKVEENFMAENIELSVYPDSLKEVFVNLITNAEQALEREGTIKVATYKENNSLVISVEDNGKGINDDEMKHLFDPFFTTKTTGTGIGLALSRKIVQEHNGTIDVTSKVDTGTTFTIKLPITY